MQLSQATIIQASIEILDEYGLADMTMRRLATRLQVAPGALYWHFENKQALIAATARTIVAPILEAPAAPTDDHQAFATRCIALRDQIWAHRDGGELLSAAMTNNDLRHDLLTYLQEGFTAAIPQQRAATAARTALYFLLGSTVIAQAQQQLAASDAKQTTHTEPDPSFFQGIDLIIAGVYQEID